MGLYKFKWMAQWAAGGYEDPAEMKTTELEAESLKEATDKLIISRLAYGRENCHSNFKVCQPGEEEYRRLDALVLFRGKREKRSIIFKFEIADVRFELQTSSPAA